MKKIILSGASGFVGEALMRHYAKTDVEVVRLVRGIRPTAPSERPWNPTRGELDPAILAGADAVVNLNGRNIAGGRWTARVKNELLASRLGATTTLVAAIARTDRPPKVLINASATGFYGDRGDEVLTESSPAGNGFLADLAQDWERAAAEAGSATTRVVMLRFGMVIGDGGALKKMLPPFKLGLGGPMGSGRQWWPWIAMNDVVGVVDHVLGHQDLAGPVNVVAPEAVTSKGFARALGKYLGVPAIVPAPAFAVRLALGEMADALLLSSTKAVPRILEETGYTFKTPTLAEAFRSTLG